MKTILLILFCGVGIINSLEAQVKSVEPTVKHPAKVRLQDQSTQTVITTYERITIYQRSIRELMESKELGYENSVSKFNKAIENLQNDLISRAESGRFHELEQEDQNLFLSLIKERDSDKYEKYSMMLNNPANR